jgi:ASC-1-like (ASCH) protein
MITKKKAWPEMFEAVLNGKKKFDLRLDDFECKEGDTLILEEWNPETKEYTGRKIEKKVSYVMKTKDLKFWKKEDIEKFGFHVISFE